MRIFAELSGDVHELGAHCFSISLKTANAREAIGEVFRGMLQHLLPWRPDSGSAFTVLGTDPALGIQDRSGRMEESVEFQKFLELLGDQSSTLFRSAKLEGRASASDRTVVRNELPG